jgi:hypothetical protein
VVFQFVDPGVISHLRWSVAGAQVTDGRETTGLIARELREVASLRREVARPDRSVHNPLALWHSSRTSRLLDGRS